MQKETKLVLLGRQGVQHLENLRLVGAGIDLAVVPVDRLPRLAASPGQRKRGKQTIGRRSLSGLCLAILRASETLAAPSTMAPGLPE